MRNIFKIGLSFIFLITSFSACYDDTGNYNYSNLPDVSISAKDTVYATQFKTLELPIEIKLSSGSEKDYDFSWRIWSNALGGVSNQKIIGNTKTLSYLVTEVPGSYSLVLTCHNKETGVKSFKKIFLVVQGIITEGWMVLHEKNGTTDFDMIMSPFFSNRVKEVTVQQ